MMKVLVTIPTYNEKENVEKIARAVLEATPENVHILVVDDSSPDGTGAIVKRMMESESRLNLLVRGQKQGLGRAYIAAFKWGLERGYDLIVEMDADFSHRPQDLLKIIEAARNSDFVVGSRYVAGGGTVNWTLMRKIISRGGSLYSRFILGFPLNDWTGGFNAWKKEVLNGIDLDSVLSNGYSFQIELKYRSLRKGYRGVEVPITFEDRREGKSKMSFKIVVEGFWRVWGLRFG